MTNLSMYVPHIWKSELDTETTAFLTKYYPQALKTPMCIAIEKIAIEIMHLKVVEHHLSEDLSILGQMCFTDGMAEIYDPVNDEYREIFVKAGTMIIDPDTYAKRNLGSKRNTMAHECYHWFRHSIWSFWHNGGCQFDIMSVPPTEFASDAGCSVAEGVPSSSVGAGLSTGFPSSGIVSSFLSSSFSLGGETIGKGSASSFAKSS